MLNKIILLLAVFTLTTPSYFPAFANPLSNSEQKSTYTFKYSDLKKEIENMKNLNLEQVTETVAEEKAISEEDITEEATVEETVTNDSINSDNENVINYDLGYISSFSMESTAYTGGTLTATGVPPVRIENGLSTVAVDPAVIPLGSLLYIPDYGYAIAADTGGAINGYILDLYLNSYDECINWGRRNISVYLLAYPGQW